MPCCCKTLPRACARARVCVCGGRNKRDDVAVLNIKGGGFLSFLQEKKKKRKKKKKVRL